MAGAIPAHAIDHDNLDAGRPLDFDDAETIAYGEKSLEFGAALSRSRRGGWGGAGEAEYLYGFAKNWHLDVGISPNYAAQNGGKRQLSSGDAALGAQFNFNRETEKSPAFGVRADAYLPSGRGSRGTDFRVRGIASRQLGRYGRVHLNADLTLNNRPQNSERRALPGVILGYSQPLGYPRRFNRTLVAQVSYRAAPLRGDGQIFGVGVGLRQQVTPRSVFDVGVKSDLSGGANRETWRVIAGYSTAF